MRLHFVNSLDRGAVGRGIDYSSAALIVFLSLSLLMLAPSYFLFVCLFVCLFIGWLVGSGARPMIRLWMLRIWIIWIIWIISETGQEAFLRSGASLQRRLASNQLTWWLRVPFHSLCVCEQITGAIATRERASPGRGGGERGGGGWEMERSGRNLKRMNE